MARWWRMAHTRVHRADVAMIRNAARVAVESLERRALLAADLTFAYDMAESEPNNTIPTADIVPVSATPNVVSGTIDSTSDVDYFQFTLGARSGVLLDVDSREINLSNQLDSVLRVFNDTGSVEFGSNDDGRDFDTVALNETTNTTLLFGDSALYLDLNPGTYVVEMSAPGTTGAYQLKLTADSLYTSSVPAFASLPGAADTIYLDFDGHAATDAWNNGSPYAIPAFSLDAAAGEFSPGERLAIYHTWRVVADALAPFNINVTTSYGGVFDDGIAHRQVIGNSNGAQVGHAGSLGVAWVNGYNSGGPDYKTGFTFANNFADTATSGISGKIVANAIEMGNSSAHEVGHTMGLDHYTAAAQKGAFMYVPDADVGFNRERWMTGTNGNAVFQDDLATIASATNTFGYRSDDHGDTHPAATVLGPAGSAYATSGVVHQTSDVDVFRFSGSGATTITLDIPEHLGHLDARLYLYNAAGSLVASAEPAATLGATIAMSLPAAGNYFVEVRSDGGYSDLGMYDLRINTVAAPTGGAIAGRVFRDVTLNHNYEPGSGDTHLAGVTVYLDTDDDNVLDAGEVSTTSNAADGTFSFTGLANGAYNVKQIAPDGFVSNASYNLNITSGEAHTDANFGNFPITFGGSGGNDTYTVRLNAITPATLEIVESFSGLTYAAPRSLVAALTFDGGAGGTDTLILHGTAGSDAIVVAGASATGAAADNVGFSGFEGLTVHGGAGDDTLTIAAAPAAPVQFNGGTDAATTDTLTIQAGTHTFNADARDGTANLIVNVSGNGASAVFNTTQHLEALNVLGGGFASVATNGAIMLVTQTFSMTGAAKMDLRDNDMIIHGGVVGSFNGVSYDGVTGYVASAYNFTSWDGNGLLTSMEAAGPSSGTTTLAVGTGFDVYGLGPTDVAEWQGEEITGSSVVVKYTYAGDLNFDGIVDGADYGTIDNWVQFGVSGYGNGDFNFDGVIDGADYGVIDNTIQFQGLPL